MSGSPRRMSGADVGAGTSRSPTAGSIDDVVDELDRIVGEARAAESRTGYFAALYRRVTLEVGRRVEEGRFDDAERMERLDVIFAGRYLEARRAWEAGAPITRSWRVAFEAAGDWWPIVLQHLLLGINAHINLDLGIAAARTAPGRLDALEDDFFRITRLLASMVDDVQGRLVEVWPLLAVFDRVGGRTDEATIHFSIDRARREAWRFARRLDAIPGDEWAEEIDRTDAAVAELGRRIRRPGWLLGAATRAIRLGELRSVPGVIDLLSREEPTRPLPA